jgi:hypothetical protein
MSQTPLPIQLNTKSDMHTNAETKIRLNDLSADSCEHVSNQSENLSDKRLCSKPNNQSDISSTKSANADKRRAVISPKSAIKTQSDLLKRLQASSHGPSSINSKWKSVVDPLKPQPIRS